jgi:hypothetical protein
MTVRVVPSILLLLLGGCLSSEVVRPELGRIVYPPLTPRFPLQTVLPHDGDPGAVVSVAVVRFERIVPVGAKPLDIFLRGTEMITATADGDGLVWWGTADFSPLDLGEERPRRFSGCSLDGHTTFDHGGVQNPGYFFEVEAIAYVDGSPRLLVRRPADNLEIWDGLSSESTHDLVQISPMYQIAWSTSTEWVAVETQRPEDADRTIVVVNTITMERYDHPAGDADLASVTSDGVVLLLASNAIRLLDPATGHAVEVPCPFNPRYTVMSNDGLVATTLDNVYRWDGASWWAVDDIARRPGSILVPVPGEIPLTLIEDGQSQLLLWDRLRPTEGYENERYLLAPPGSRVGAYDPVGDRVAIVVETADSATDSLIVYSASSSLGQALERNQWITHLFWGPDGHLLALAQLAGERLVVRVPEDGSPLVPLVPAPSPVAGSSLVVWDTVAESILAVEQSGGSFSFHELTFDGTHVEHGPFDGVARLIVPRQHPLGRTLGPGVLCEADDALLVRPVNAPSLRVLVSTPVPTAQAAFLVPGKSAVLIAYDPVVGYGQRLRMLEIGSFAD